MSVLWKVVQPQVEGFLENDENSFEEWDEINSFGVNWKIEKSCGATFDRIWFVNRKTEKSKCLLLVLADSFSVHQNIEGLLNPRLRYFRQTHPCKRENSTESGEGCVLNSKSNKNSDMNHVPNLVLNSAKTYSVDEFVGLKISENCQQKLT